MEVINLGIKEDTKEVRIGIALEDEMKKKLIDLLHEYMDVFSWSYKDMPELDTAIVVHRLPFKVDFLQVK